jgi:hypothetical protein
MFGERRRPQCATAQAVTPFGDDDVRHAIDALAVRVDTLSGIVRETAGSLSGNRADLAALDRRLHKRLGEETQRADATLAQIR